MEEYSINTQDSLDHLIDYLDGSKYPINDNKLKVDNIIFHIDDEFIDPLRVKMHKKYYKIIHKDNLSEFFEHLNRYELLSFDTETTGLNVLSDKVIGFSVSGYEGIGYYIPFYVWENETLKNISPLNIIKEVFDILKKKKLVMHNGSYDIRITKNDLNVDLLEALYCDTILLKHTLQEEGPFALKEIGIELQSELGLNLEEAANIEQIKLKENVQANGGSVTKGNFEMYKADLSVLGRYAAADADLTLRVYNLLSKKLKEEKLNEFFYKDEVMPLYKEVTIPMESKGVKLDLPLIEKFNKEISVDIEAYKEKVTKSLLSQSATKTWLKHISHTKFETKVSGNFAQKYVDLLQIDIPKTALGKYSITKKNLEAVNDPRVQPLITKDASLIDADIIDEIKLELWKEKEPKLINISSKTQMKELVFEFMGEESLGTTDSGAKKFNDEVVEHLATKYEWAKQLSIYNKLMKLKGAYADRFLKNHKDGYYYFYYKQHGTVSGRYGSDAQQLPRPMESGEPIILKYNNQIREFIITENGRAFVDDDYESLEPHVFSEVSSDEKIKDIFRKGHDFYSSIVIPTEKLEGVSADKSADNYLKNVYPEKRQVGKAYSLGVPYGLKAYKLSKMLEIEIGEAKVIINNYLNAFPDLKSWMKESDKFTKANGYIKSRGGRIRHLPQVKKLYKIHGDNLLDWRYRKRLESKLGREYVRGIYLDYNNGLNNCKNWQIQSFSASIVNRAMIAITREFKARKIDAWITGQFHDQVICNVPEDKKEECRQIVQDKMENTTKLSIDLKAPAEIGYNWKDAH